MQQILSSLRETSMSRNTPAAVARLLRQEAGFGCCVCGTPILQYHHIVEWADEQHFRPQDMMVLCPTHHDQATKGAMPEVEQRQYKAAPNNIKRGLVDGTLKVRQDYCAASFGSVMMVGEGTFLQMDGKNVLGFNIEDQHLKSRFRSLASRTNCCWKSTETSGSRATHCLGT
jgi:hypothetical protein